MVLSPEERNALYGIPALSDAERTEYFTFNDAELSILYRFKTWDSAVYFAIRLAFFKLRYTLIDFSYRDVTKERQHVMQRYFVNKPSPRSLPSDKETITRIDTKILAVVGFSRFKDKSKTSILNTLSIEASLYPRQRQLCQALLKLLYTKCIAIPSYPTLCDVVSKQWNQELNRVIKAYRRYSTKENRRAINHLLSKTDNKHRIVSIRKDMQGFTTHEIRAELEKHRELSVIFSFAKQVIPALRITPTTVKYYAELINHYNGTRLKQLTPDTAQLYLLCYAYSRFQISNDNLLETFKKRTLTYASDAKKFAEHEATKFVGSTAAVRKKVYDLLMVIKTDASKTSIPKHKLYRCIPYSELESVADIILNDNLNLDHLYWRYIAQHSTSIQLNLRPIFLGLDITILRNEPLRKVVKFMQAHFSKINRWFFQISSSNGCHTT